jgi:hypothetical protein
LTASQLARDVEALAARGHLDVEEDEVGRPPGLQQLAHLGQRILAALGFQDLVAAGPELDAHEGAVVLLVVDDQDRRVELLVTSRGAQGSSGSSE